MVSTKRFAAVLLLFSLVFCVGCKDKLERSVDDYLKADKDLCDLLGKIHDKQTLDKYSSQVLDKCREVYRFDKKMRSIEGYKFEVDDLEEKIKKQDRELDAAYEESFSRIARIDGGPEFIESVLNILIPDGASSNFRFDPHLPRTKPFNFRPPKIERPKMPEIHIPKPPAFNYTPPKIEHPFHQENKRPTIERPTIERPSKPLVDLASKAPEELVGYFDYSEEAIATDAIRRANRVNPGSVTKNVRKVVAMGLKEVAEDSRRKSTDRCEAIKGMVIWGGKHSAPILLGILKETVESPSGYQTITMQKVILEALNDFRDCSRPDMVSQVLALGNGNMYEASKYLARVGPKAESMVIKSVPRDVSLELMKETIELLGEIGDKESLKAFERLRLKSPRPVYAQVRDDVNAARKKILARRKALKRTEDRGQRTEDR